jgi:alkylation response protein AidB-like acyl-CoA dehydrogenase
MAQQVFGGVGFTLEYDIQLFFRRARGWTLVAGDPSKECLALSDRLYGPAGGVEASRS